VNFSIPRNLFHFGGTDPQPVPGNGPTVPSDGSTAPLPPSVGLAAIDGVDFSQAAKRVIVCPDGTQPAVKVEGNTVTVACEPVKPKPAPKEGTSNVPILD
jgi:hypothetical protein